MALPFTAYIGKKEIKCCEYMQRTPMNIHRESGCIQGALEEPSMSCGYRQILGPNTKSSS